MEEVVNKYFKIKNEAIIDYCFKNEVSKRDAKLAYFLLEEEDFFIYGDPIKIIEKDQYYKVSFKNLKEEARKKLLDSAIDTCEQVMVYTGNRINRVVELLEDLKHKRQVVISKKFIHSPKK